MTYDVIVENHQDSYRAMVMGWPDCHATGRTREEAVALLREDLHGRLAKVEIISVEVETPPDKHPMLKLAGIFKEDPLWDEFQDEIAAYRRGLDAAEGIV